MPREVWRFEEFRAWGLNSGLGFCGFCGFRVRASGGPEGDITGQARS